MAIAEMLVEQVLRVAEENKAARVNQVEVRMGLMRQVVPEALELAFEAVAKDTLAEGARLSIIEEGITARCLNCDIEFEGHVDFLQCPQCGLANIKIIAGNDIVLTSLECEQEANQSTEDNKETS